MVKQNAPKEFISQGRRRAANHAFSQYGAEVHKGTGTVSSHPQVTSTSASHRTPSEAHSDHIWAQAAQMPKMKAGVVTLGTFGYIKSRAFGLKQSLSRTLCAKLAQSSQPAAGVSCVWA